MSRFGKAVAVIAVVAAVLAVLPVPAGVIVAIVIGVPVVLMLVAYKVIDHRLSWFRFRYHASLVRTQQLDDAEYDTAAQRSLNTGFARAFLTIGLIIAVLFCGLIIGGLAVGINEAIYG